MTIIDGLSSFSQLAGWTSQAMRRLRLQTLQKLSSLVNIPVMDRTLINARISEGSFLVGSFSLPSKRDQLDHIHFNFDAPTTCENAMRLVRACQIHKPILLEGSPGVGKTSLVMAVAEALGQQLCRINLSDQTDLVDLFGSDLPQEGSTVGEFVWRDADFLRALRQGDWVLLDEMNLANQSVLEGLNAVLDHRGTVYIPELDRSFVRHPDFRIFAAQNPLHQGSGRKGLPKSFLNRFTKVYVEPLSSNDLLLIGQRRYPFLAPTTLERMIEFNTRLQVAVVEKQQFGLEGAPWEFNLRDVMRWSALLEGPNDLVKHPACYLDTIYTSRFRADADRQMVYELFKQVFHDEVFHFDWRPHIFSTGTRIHCGVSTVTKGEHSCAFSQTSALPQHASAFESAMAGVSRGWLVIITGVSGSGKSGFVHSLSQACRHPLRILSLSGASDTSDLIGSFEQTERTLFVKALGEHFEHYVDSVLDNTTYLLPETTMRLREAQVAAQIAVSSNELQALVKVAQELLQDSPIAGSSAHTTLDEAVQTSLDQTQGSFQWVDGPLVKAMRQGYWLVLDGANLCSPSVLDRLNSLCEMGGSLVLTEKGLDQSPITPHPNFRLFMLVNNGLGEISRAMRNRGIEIALDQSALSKNGDIVLNSCRVPTSMLSSNLSRHEARLLHAIRRRSLVGKKLDAAPCLRTWSYTIPEDHVSLRLQRVSNIIAQCSSGDDELATGMFALMRLTSKSSLPRIVRAIRQLNRGTCAWVVEALEQAVAVMDDPALYMLRRKSISASEHEQSEIENLVSDVFVLDTRATDLVYKAFGPLLQHAHIYYSHQ